MRRFVTGTAAYFERLISSVVQGWNSFFFRPSDPTPLGVIRVVVGLLLFWSLLVYGLDLHDWFGSTGWANPDALRAVQTEPQPYTWSFWTHVPDSLLWPVWAVCLAIVALFTVGLWSRATAVLVWVIVVSTVRRVPVSLFGFDQIISTLTLYLAVSGASGQAVSLDRFLRRWKLARAATVRRLRDGRWPLESGVPAATVSANLGLRLIQLHFCVIYGMSGLAKLLGPSWWGGTALWPTISSGEFNLLDLTWMAHYPVLLNSLTHISLATEILYPVLIWPRVTRPLMMGFVVMLHLGIGLTAPGLIEFGLAMYAGNLAFVSGTWLRSLVTGVDRSKPAARVLYDGACPRCRASISFLTAADPDHLIEPVDLTAVDVKTIHPSLTPEACMKAMHVVEKKGGVSSGFDAIIALGRLLPPFWLPSMLGSLPGLRQAGRKVYQIVADSRPRDVVCTDEVCGIPSHAPRGRSKERPEPTRPPLSTTGSTSADSDR